MSSLRFLRISCGTTLVLFLVHNYLLELCIAKTRAADFMVPPSSWSAAHGSIARVNPPLFYINSDASVGRRQSLVAEARMRNLTTVQRVPAIFGTCCLPHQCCSCSLDAGLVLPEGQGFSAEIGTLLAHLAALRAVWDSGLEWGLIVEDDVSFRFEPLWGKQDLGQLLAELPNDWEVVQLYYFVERWQDLEFRLGRWKQGAMVSKRSNEWGAVAYLVHRRGLHSIFAQVWPALVSERRAENSGACANGTIILNLAELTQCGLVSECLLFLVDSFLLTNKPLFDHQSGQSSVHSSHVQLHHRASERLSRFFYQNASINADGSLSWFDRLVYFFPQENKSWNFRLFSYPWFGVLAVLFSPLRRLLARFPTLCTVGHGLWYVVLLVLGHLALMTNHATHTLVLTVLCFAMYVCFMLKKIHFVLTGNGQSTTMNVCNSQSRRTKL